MPAPILRVLHGHAFASKEFRKFGRQHRRQAVIVIKVESDVRKARHGELRLQDLRAGDGSLEDPDLAARRELEEETGFRAGSWEHLGAFWTAPGFATELMHLYLDRELTPDFDKECPFDWDEQGVEK